MGMMSARTVVALMLVIGWAGHGQARVYKTQKIALSEVFLGGYERKTTFLTEKQIRLVEKQSRSRIESKILTYYEGKTVQGNSAGLAFFDTHTVRSSKEVVFVWIAADGRVARTEILAFFEPEDYKVRQGWLDRLEGKGTEDELTVNRDLDGVTGATLTVRSLAAAVRRSLALSRLVLGDVQ
jgi:hypothetical protein